MKNISRLLTPFIVLALAVGAGVAAVDSQGQTAALLMVAAGVWELVYQKEAS